MNGDDEGEEGGGAGEVLSVFECLFFFWFGGVDVRVEWRGWWRWGGAGGGTG